MTTIGPEHQSYSRIDRIRPDPAPLTVERIPHPGLLSLLPDQIPDLTDRDRTDLISVRQLFGFFTTRPFLREVPPEYLDICIISIAYEPRNVQIVPGKVRGGVEEFYYVLLAYHLLVNDLLSNIREPIRAHTLTFQAEKHLPGSIQLFRCVGKGRTLLISGYVNPVYLGFVILAGPVAPSKPLHECRPGRELGEERLSRDINTRLDDLCGDDDGTFRAGFLK